MSLGLQGHSHCLKEFEKVLNTLKEEIKSEAHKLRNGGLPVEEIFITLNNLVLKKGWKELDKRLKQLFPGDEDPLNISRSRMAGLFYHAKSTDFNVHFKEKIKKILKGEEIHEIAEVFVTKDVSSDSDVEEIEEDSDTEIKTDLE